MAMAHCIYSGSSIRVSLQARLERRHQIDYLRLGPLLTLWLLHIQRMGFFLTYLFLDPALQVRAVGILELTGGEVSLHALHQLLRHGKFC